MPRQVPRSASVKLASLGYGRTLVGPAMWRRSLEPGRPMSHATRRSRSRFVRRAVHTLAARALPMSAFVGLSVCAAPAFAQQWPTTDPRFVSSSEAGGPAEQFGQVGQIALSSAFDLDFQYRMIAPGKGLPSRSSTHVVISPALDIFLRKNLALGGVIRIAHTSADTVRETGALVAPTLGYNVLVARRLSFFPKIGLGFAYKTTTLVTPQVGERTQVGWRLAAQISLPLLFHPVPNFFVGFGPVVSRDFLSSVEDPVTHKDVDGPIDTVFALAFHLGGYF